jgi:hypothetical protein
MFERRQDKRGDESCRAVGMNPRDRDWTATLSPRRRSPHPVVEFAVRPYAEPSAELGLSSPRDEPLRQFNSLWTAPGTELCLGLV